MAVYGGLSYHCGRTLLLTGDMIWAMEGVAWSVVALRSIKF